MANPYVGRTIDSYRLDAVVGDGGMGTVFRAQDLNLDRQVAVKLMHAHFARRPEFRERLRQEAKIAASFDHPSIVRIFDFGETDDLSYIVMEYITGGSLRDHLQRLQSQQRYLPSEHSLQIGYQIAGALQYAHGRGLIHRDVKPSNIILKRLPRPDDPDEMPFRAVLTDFGLVKVLEGERLTQSGATLGTPIYMSPEQCRGQVLDGRSDLYSLGVVLYELFTNRLPFQFKSLAEAVEGHAAGIMPPPPSSVNPAVPAVIDVILEKALTKAAGGRYQSAEEMSVALRSALTAMSDEPTEVYSQVIAAAAPLATGAAVARPVQEPPEGFVLTIETPGYPSNDVPLTKTPISLGRGANNDIVLPATGVSREHAILQATEAGWSVVDKDSANGSLLNGARIGTAEAREFQPGDELQIGPYRLRLAGPERATEALSVAPIVGAAAVAGAAAAAATSGTAGQTTIAATQPSPAGAPVELFLSRDNITIDPGQAVELTVDIVNRSDQRDRVAVQVQGIPDQWVILEDGYITVAARSTTSTVMRVQVPRDAGAAVGRQRFRVVARSQTYPDARVAVSASLIVGTFTAFEASLEPAEVRVPDTISVSVLNKGNVPLDLAVVGHDADQVLQFEGESGRVQAAAGGQVVVPLEVSAKSRSLMGSADRIPFEVEVRARTTTGQTAGQQTLEGAAISQPLVPAWLQYALLALVVFSCVTLAMVLLFNTFLGGNAAAAVTGTASAVTATAVSQRATEVAAQATSGAATSSPAASTTPNVIDPLGDPDLDSLSNGQEAIAGTDPLNPDTDGDGLTDGEEVLGFGCDPLLIDTDGDTFSDFNESKVILSDCNDADDPIARTGTATVTGTPTATPTMAGPPTRTPGPPPPSPPTRTPPSPPSPTWTPLPPPTATPTAPPPTATPTATATELPPTETPTETPPPPPAFALACTTVVPVIDGNLGDATWASGPALTFVSPSNPARVISFYAVKGGLDFYFAAQITDNTPPGSSNALNLLFDVDGSGGAPDVRDRWFEMWRDDASRFMYRGTGAGWSANVPSLEWASSMSPFPSEPWIVEMEINAIELAGMSNPFGFMVQVVFGDGAVAYEQGSDVNNPSTWISVSNPDCPPPGP